MKLEEDFESTTKRVKDNIPLKLLESVWFHMHCQVKRKVAEIKTKHRRKLEGLRISQDKPPLNTKNYITILDDIAVPPKVIEILRLHRVQCKLDEERFLAQTGPTTRGLQRIRTSLPKTANWIT